MKAENIRRYLPWEILKKRGPEPGPGGTQLLEVTLMIGHRFKTRGLSVGGFSSKKSTN